VDVSADKTYLVFQTHGAIYPVAGVAFYRTQSRTDKLLGEWGGALVVDDSGMTAKISDLYISNIVSGSFWQRLQHRLISLRALRVTFENSRNISSCELAKLIKFHVSIYGLDCLNINFDMKILDRYISDGVTPKTVKDFFRSISVPEPKDALDLL
jgi:hypothetical protein